jgi:uracil-DNA glycosylase family 4
MTCGRIDLGCTKCRLSGKRTRVVPGVGSRSSGIVFIGEAPGKDEDLKGEPFIGRSGKLLDLALEEAGVRRTQVYISNLVMCRPPNNRRPRKDEIRTCTSLYLEPDMADISPQVVCALGQTVAEHFLGRKRKMKDIVGREFELTVAGRKTRLFVAYHPAACLYQRKNLAKFKDSIRSSLEAAALVQRAAQR